MHKGEHGVRYKPLTMNSRARPEMASASSYDLCEMEKFENEGQDLLEVDNFKDRTADE
jgi:hypothetical protein